MTAHALLSASSAERWLACPPSARATENIPDEGSAYTIEGSQAHAIAELKLRKYFLEGIGPRTFNTRLKKIRESKEYEYEGKPTYQEEMLRYTDEYLDYTKGAAMAFKEKPYVAVEKRVDFSDIVPGGFGTCDCVMIGGDTMHVIDFKYGKGVPVVAVKNPQMLLYAWGAYRAYRLVYPIQHVKLSIVQPRLDSISEWEWPLEELVCWAHDVVKPIAKLAFDGAGEFSVGAHCRFCKIKGNCRARTEEAFKSVPMAEKPAATLTEAELADALQKAEMLAAWAKDVQEYSLSALLSGAEIPGWKAVHGRSIRRFTDPEAAFKAIVGSGVEEALLYERKPLTLAAVEKLMGKQAFANVAGAFVETPPGKPTLAPESDKREAIKGITVEEAFKDI
jgi:hypothetical protein